MDFQIIDLKTIDFTIAEKLELPSDLSKAPVTISVRLQMHYHSGDELLVQILNVAFSNESEVMARLSVQVAYNVKGLPDNDASLREYEPVRQATLVTVGFLDGVLQEKLNASPISTLYLPLPEMGRLFDKAEIYKIS